MSHEQLPILASEVVTARPLQLRACPAGSGMRSRPPERSTRPWGASYATSMTTAPSSWQMSASGYAAIRNRIGFNRLHAGEEAYGVLKQPRPTRM